MDTVLKELKSIREKVEERFRNLVERIEAEQEAARAGLDALAATYDNLDPDIAAGFEQVAGQLTRMRETFLLIVEALREMAALDNARSAELARQVTVLPLDRMDLVLEKFEKRLESLEVELQRVRKG